MANIKTGQLRPLGTNPNNVFKFAQGEFCCNPVEKTACQYTISISLVTPQTIIAFGYTRDGKDDNYLFGTAGIVLSNTTSSVAVFQQQLTHALGGMMVKPGIVLTHDSVAQTLEIQITGVLEMRNLQFVTGASQSFSKDCITPFLIMTANFAASMDFQGSINAGLEMTANLEFTADGHEVEVNASKTYAWSIEKLSGDATATLTSATGNMTQLNGFSQNMGDFAKWRVTCVITFTYLGVQYQVTTVGVVIYSYDSQPNESVLDAVSQYILFTGSMENYNIQSDITYVAENPTNTPTTLGLAALNGDNSATLFPLTSATGQNMQPIYGVGITLGRVSIKPNAAYNPNINLGEIWGNYLIFANQR